MSVVLLHGGGQTRHSWEDTADRLAQAGFDTSAFDLRGHGDSDWAPDGDYRVEAFADDLHAVGEWLGEKPAVAGASMGGLAALVGEGERHPGSLRALVLVDVSTRIEAAGVERIVSFMLGHAEGFASLDEAADAVAAYRPGVPRRQGPPRPP